MEEAPLLSYDQLFSFQVAFRDGGKKCVEWEKCILELSFTSHMFILIKKERVILTRPFNLYTTCGFLKDVDDPFLSISFGCGEWRLNVQNGAEKECLLHLLKCVRRNMTAEEAVRYGSEIIGLDKRILKYGTILRKAQTKRRRTERFLVIVPGKLFMFTTRSIEGRHARSVTSLFRANVKMSFTQLEFQIVAHYSKEREMSSWITALEESILLADPNTRLHAEASITRSISEEEVQNQRQSSQVHILHKLHEPEQREGFPLMKEDEQRRKVIQSNDCEARKDTDSSRRSGPNDQTKGTFSRERLKAAIEDMSNTIGRLHAGNSDRWSSMNSSREPEPGVEQPPEHSDSSDNFYTNSARGKFPSRSAFSGRYQRRVSRVVDETSRERVNTKKDGKRHKDNIIEEFREPWRRQSSQAPFQEQRCLSSSLRDNNNSTIY